MITTPPRSKTNEAHKETMSIMDIWKTLRLEEEGFFSRVYMHNNSFDLKQPEDYIFANGINKVSFLKNIAKLLTFSDSGVTAYIGWGFSRDARKAFRSAVIHSKPFFMAEDGFIRSIFSYATKDVTGELKEGISFTITSDAFYFVGDRETSLEKLLNNFEVSEDQRHMARIAINKIIENKISKYNNQPLKIDKVGKTNKEKVLVIDQSYGDASLKYGMVTDDVFAKMINDAINDNPECEVLFKIHPDNIARNCSRYAEMLPKNVTIINEYTNPLVLLSMVKKVYVATSQLGFEALLLGKDVNVYGMPFYSNWGLTNDYLKCERRTRVLSIEEMFFIVYMVYSRYINPVTGEKITVIDAIDYIYNLRTSYFRSRENLLKK